MAHGSDIEHVHEANATEVKSSLVVQGTIVTKHKKGNSAIVNQTAVWEGRTYTLNPKTGKLTVRAKNDNKHGLPALKIDKVGDGVVHFVYTDKATETPVVFKKRIKSRNGKYGLNR